MYVVLDETATPAVSPATFSLDQIHLEAGLAPYYTLDADNEVEARRIRERTVATPTPVT